MSEGITGLNPSQAKVDISNFQSEFFAATDKCAGAVDSLIEGLLINWASPKAVEFMKSNEEKIIEAFYSHPTAVCDEIVTGAINAFNSISASQGGATIADFGHMGIGVGGFELYPEIDGNVGMNIANVRTLLSAFEAGVESGLVDYDNLPTTIAFYDPSGSMAASYSTKIKTLANEIRNTTKDIVNSIKTAITEEQDNTNLGKQAAVDAMDGVASTPPYNPQSNSTPPYNPNQNTNDYYGGGR